jgi:hypothetical protein
MLPSKLHLASSRSERQYRECQRHRYDDIDLLLQQYSVNAALSSYSATVIATASSSSNLASSGQNCPQLTSSSCNAACKPSWGSPRGDISGRYRQFPRNCNTETMLDHIRVVDAAVEIEGSLSEEYILFRRCSRRTTTTTGLS